MNVHKTSRVESGGEEYRTRDFPSFLEWRHIAYQGGFEPCTFRSKSRQWPLTCFPRRHMNRSSSLSRSIWRPFRSPKPRPSTTTKQRSQISHICRRGKPPHCPTRLCRTMTKPTTQRCRLPSRTSLSKMTLNRSAKKPSTNQKSPQTTPARLAHFRHTMSTAQMTTKMCLLTKKCRMTTRTCLLTKKSRSTTATSHTSRSIPKSTIANSQTALPIQPKQWRSMLLKLLPTNPSTAYRSMNHSTVSGTKKPKRPILSHRLLIPLR